VKVSVKSVDILAGARAVADLAEAQRYRRKGPSRIVVEDPAAELFRPMFGQEHGALPAQRLYRLDGAVVFGKGAICLNGAVVRENLEGAPVEQILSLAARASTSPVRVIHDPVLYTTRYGVKNYGHCLTDIVPRIVQALRAMPGLRVALHPEFVPTARQALEALGCPERCIITLDEQPTLLAEGYFPSPCNAHPLVHSPQAIGIARGVHGESVLARNSPVRADRLFVTRSDAATRHLGNHEQVARFLKERGYVEVAVGSMSHLQQAALFHQATEIVGIAGAALTNLIYCRAGAKMAVLAPASMPALYFWDLAAQTGLDFQIGYFPAADPSRGIHSDFTVDLAALDQLTGPAGSTHDQEKKQVSR
jgi:hypothetical protein